ncbi:hypothetical protein B0H16DRAFT_1752187 [Mycena metata]|uniref:Uncharacterized protein n=1 Tax=Mycena metata TaxID=1033252 RepID=A0AAD7DHY6_9AGAR|nr:hypothetical protein B0H16DRAFT_1752187 [Mycena metata]
MVEKVIDVALEDDGPDGLIAKAGVERNSLKKLMMRKLESYRVEWKGFQPRFNEDLGRLETTQEARARGAQTFEQHQLTARSTSAKHRKYEDRVQAIVKTIGIKKDNGTANDIATWERLLKMVELLGEHGMSSEEEDYLEANVLRTIPSREVGELGGRRCRSGGDDRDDVTSSPSSPIFTPIGNIVNSLLDVPILKLTRHQRMLQLYWRSLRALLLSSFSARNELPPHSVARQLALLPIHPPHLSPMQHVCGSIAPTPPAAMVVHAPPAPAPVNERKRIIQFLFTLFVLETHLSGDWRHLILPYAACLLVFFPGLIKSLLAFFH